MAGGAGESGRSVTSKVTAILMVFSRGSAYSLTELARLSGLPVSTAHRLAGELAERRLLERNGDGHYQIGLPLRMIGAGGLAGATDPSEPSLLDHAGDTMVDLALATGSRVRIGVLRDGDVAEAEARPGGPAPVAFVAAEGPVGGCALGRVLLAFGPAAAVEELLAARPAPERLRRSLRVTRLTRFAVSRRASVAVGRAGTARVPRPGAVAMPVFGAGGTLLAALGLELADLRSGLPGGHAALAVATGSLSRQLATTDAVVPSPLPAALPSAAV